METSRAGTQALLCGSSTPGGAYSQSPGSRKPFVVPVRPQEIQRHWKVFAAGENALRDRRPEPDWMTAQEPFPLRLAEAPSTSRCSGSAPLGRGLAALAAEWASVCPESQAPFLPASQEPWGESDGNSLPGSERHPGPHSSKFPRQQRESRLHSGSRSEVTPNAVLSPLCR